MMHLTDRELADAIELPAQIPAEHRRHLDDCADCRRAVDSLRAVLARVAEDTAPQPSPLFWDHFAARVSASVRDASITREPSWNGWLQRPVTTWAVAGAALLVAILTVVWRATLHAPSPVAPTATSPSVASKAPASGDVSSPVDNLDADARWAVVRVAAEDLKWEDVHDAGIAADPGAAEGVALELTAAERSELARLLDREMKRNGV